MSGDTGAPGKSQSWGMPALSPSEPCPFVGSPSLPYPGVTGGVAGDLLPAALSSPRVELLFVLLFPNIPFSPSITPTPSRWNSYITQQKASDKFQPAWVLLQRRPNNSSVWGVSALLVPLWVWRMRIFQGGDEWECCSVINDSPEPWSSGNGEKGGCGESRATREWGGMSLQGSAALPAGSMGYMDLICWKTWDRGR